MLGIKLGSDRGLIDRGKRCALAAPAGIGQEAILRGNDVARAAMSDRWSPRTALNRTRRGRCRCNWRPGACGRHKRCRGRCSAGRRARRRDRYRCRRRPWSCSPGTSPGRSRPASRSPNAPAGNGARRKPHAIGDVTASSTAPATLLARTFGSPPGRHGCRRLGVGVYRRRRLLHAAEQEIEETGVRRARQGKQGRGRKSARGGHAPRPRPLAMRTHHGHPSQPSPVGARNVPQAGTVPALAARLEAGRSTNAARQYRPASK